MKKKLYIIMLLLTAAVTVFMAVGCNTDKKDNAEGLEFALINDDTAYEVSLKATMRDGNMKVVIPSSYNGLPVTRIANYGFSFPVTGVPSVDPYIVSVEIPNSITSIGEYAFSGSFHLTSILIPDSVTSIEYEAFSSCGLTSVTIPNSVTLGDNAFSNCSLLSSIETNSAAIPSGNGIYVIDKDGKTVKSNGVAVVVKSNDTHTLSFAVGAIQSITIPNSVTDIGHDAFSYCGALTSITIPDSVASIGFHAFAGCASLTSITVPSSVAVIEHEAFYRSESLTIYAQADSKPDGWLSEGADSLSGYKNWNTDGRPVIWGCTTDSDDGYAYVASLTITDSTFENTEDNVIQAPCREGYTFNGWYENQDLTGAMYAASDIATVGAGVTLYAEWVKK